MLNIFYGRESVDKEKFIYETIAERGYNAASPVIVLVPDQYTLEAERQAFRITGKEAFVGLDVYSISRLGHNILAKEGSGNIQFIDKYGRQMLLTGILSGMKDNLSVYGASVKKPSFIEMVNDYISSLKQYDVSPEALEELASGMDGNDALVMKMRDISRIYTEYDKSIRGKYTDSEDYVDLFIEKAGQSELLAKARVWVYGFDSFAPKSMKVLGRLMKLCPEVNIVLTYDKDTEDEALFELTGKVMENLKEAARENDAEIGKTVSIAKAFPDGRYSVKGNDSEIRHLEHELFNPVPALMYEGKGGDDGKSSDNGGKSNEDYGKSGTWSEGITLTEAANYYNEAETAASYILHLIRDKKYRYRDIAVICNDTESLGSALKRAFDEYDIPCFLDNKRSISGSGISAYIIALVTACIRGMRTSDIFLALKTGLGILSQEETEQLENYAICYKIDRFKWSRKFRYGKSRYTDEELAALEESRKKISDFFGRLAGILKARQTYSEFLTSFYRFLVEDAGITVRLTTLMDAQNQAGLRDLSEETRQVWQMIINILDQISNILGDKPFDPEEFLQIFTVGLRQAQVGLMPPSPDDLMIGTMQRTRVGSVKAIIVVGANDGVIPQGSGGNGLFAEQEEERLAESGFEACKSEKVRRQEEKLAIYRNLSKPDSELWISYTAADAEGGQLRPSELIEDIQRVFPDKKNGRDILNTGRPADMVSGKISTLRHMTEAFVKEKSGVKHDRIWDGVLDWYKENDPSAAASILNGLGFENRADGIGKDLSGIMLSGRGENGMSASKLELYAACPFAYYVEYGLKPQERQIFEAGSQEIGNVYHETLMEITSKMTSEGLWDSITPEEVTSLVRSTVQKKRSEFEDGVLNYTGGDSYRTDRAEQTLIDALNVLIRHARAGKIRDSKYETEFGRYCDIRPVEVTVDGKKVYIEGKIDRLDTLENGRVKIMDYKSGHQIFDEGTIRAGYSLQLMLYMKAAQEGVREPAGVFYFYLGTKGIDVSGNDDISITAESDPEKIAELRDASMRGILVDDPETISEVLGDDEAGKIASIKKKKSGEYSGSNGSMVLNEGDFKDLQKAVDDKIGELVKGITEGRIDIKPLRRKNENLACRYCDYRGICRFDIGFKGCTYNNIK